MSNIDKIKTAANEIKKNKAMSPDDIFKFH